ncbi:PREDICTED: uncharacterized protein LOC108553837 [Eufriesea mexicana]|nr:PREDICTED: uncharacterized protein LOC108553837 [Eufriesea mexicana]
MKSIITICFILAVANANPFWRNGKEWPKHHHPPGHWFPPEDTPMPKCLPFQPPEHFSLKLEPLLETLFSFKANQKNSPMQSCAAVWVCRKPETNDIIITEIDGTQTVVSKQSPNESNGQMSSTETNTMSYTTPEVETEVNNTAGVGLLDIRSSAQ